MFCAISGVAPEHPVVSTKSGHIFEQSVVEKYIETTGKCPVTSEPMELSDLLPVKTTTTTKPRNLAATSIPGMLQLFQNEWDAVMLECFTLKQQLETVRQELGRSLYEHDAACRVIARLIKERDDARQALAEMRPSAPAAPAVPAAASNGGASAAGGSAAAMEVEATGLSAEASAHIDATHKSLSKGRKKRAMPAGYPDAAALSAYSQVGAIPAAHTAGPTCLDSHATQPRVATGGADGSVVIASSSAADGLQKSGGYSSGSQRLSAIKLHPTQDLLLASSHDGTAKLHEASSGTLKHTFAVHAGPVTGCALHATGDYAVTASTDRTWALVDLNAGSCVLQTRDDAQPLGYSCTSLHPDGLILATGMDKTIRVWELKSQTNAANFEGHAGGVTCLAFSENGYHLATGSDDSTVKLWDLRKLSNFQTLELSGPVSSLAFDNSGGFLCVGSSAGVALYESKTWSGLASFDGTGSAAVTGLSFGAGAQTIACASAAGVVALYGAK